MASQETMDFVKNIIKNILSKWESLPLDMRDKMRDELMSVFITFVGAFVGENKTTLTLVLLRVFPKHIFLRGVVATPLWIINTEGHITLNLLPMYRYGHPLSIDTKISTNH